MRLTARRSRARNAVTMAAIAGLAMSMLAAPSASGARNHAPDAPTHLRVGERVAPLAVADTPTFGWMPQDKDPGEIQSAYQVQVVDASNESPFWDSGKVTSDDQAFVPYGGPDLLSAHDYAWRVRTWDSADNPSPWSAWAAFTSGRADEDWHGAEWIQPLPQGSGPLSTSNGGLRLSDSEVVLADTGSEWVDYTFDLTIRPIFADVGVVFRATDADNAYLWDFVPDEGIVLTTLVDGSSSVLDTVPVNISQFQFYDVRIELEGSTIRTYFNGDLVDERVDETHSQGTIGLRADGFFADYDNITVTAPDATVLFENHDGDTDPWITPRSRADDEWALFRREVELEGSDVVNARLWTAGMHTFDFYIEGQRVDRGSFFAYPDEGFYQVTDVTEAVQKVEGAPMTLGAVHHWYGSGQGRAAGETGLLALLEVTFTDGGTQVVTSDSDWSTTEAYYLGEGSRNGEGLRIEHLDGPAKAALAGWEEEGFDDSAWSDVIVAGEHPSTPWTSLSAQETRVLETVVGAVSLSTADDGTVVADFGKVIPARPVVDFDEGLESREIEMYAGYNLTETGRVDRSNLATQGTNMSYPYTQVDGEQTFTAFTHLGFRYLEIPGAEEDIALEDVRAIQVHTDYPADRLATFSSSDETLNRVWDLTQHSAINSIQETFVDTPTREQAQFLGDAAAISYATMQGFSERDATQQAIREFVASQARYWTSGNDVGRYNAVYPNGDGKRDIPDYSEIFVDWVWRYYEVTGDEQLLAEVFPAMVNTADYVLRHIPDDGPTAGLVTNLSGGSGPYQYGIVDWPEPGRFGYDMSTAARTTINALGVEVLNRTADIADVLGEPGSEMYRDASEALANEMNARLRDTDGIYVDGLASDGTPSSHRGQHSSSYAIAFGVAPQEDYDLLADYIAGLGMRQGPMTAHWLLQALQDADRPDAVLELLTNPDDLGWANVLSQDGTFTWEAWTLDQGSNFSQSHGWGAQAGVDIIETMLGIRLGEAGPADVAIAPPSVGLQHATGTVHTERGPVSLEWKREDLGPLVRLELPVNVTATVSLPVVDGVDYRAVGRTKATRIGREGDRVIFEVGSGRSQFVPVNANAAPDS